MNHESDFDSLKYSLQVSTSTSGSIIDILVTGLYDILKADSRDSFKTEKSSFLDTIKISILGKSNSDKLLVILHLFE